jgi:hypothetical protein
MRLAVATCFAIKGVLFNNLKIIEAKTELSETFVKVWKYSR